MAVVIAVHGLHGGAVIGALPVLEFPYGKHGFALRADHVGRLVVVALVPRQPQQEDAKYDFKTCSYILILTEVDVIAPPIILVFFHEQMEETIK